MKPDVHLAKNDGCSVFMGHVCMDSPIYFVKSVDGVLRCMSPTITSVAGAKDMLHSI